VNRNKVIAFHFSNLVQIKKDVWIVNMNKIPIRINGVLRVIFNEYLSYLEEEEVFEKPAIVKSNKTIGKIINNCLKLINKNKIYVKRS